MTLNQIIEELKKLADPEKILIKKTKFGIDANNALGVYLKDLKELARQLPKNDDLAIQLFDTGIYEARLLCSKIFNVQNLTEPLMEKWVGTFDNWEICDSFCMGLFAKSKFAKTKILEWTTREKEFEKRAGFTIMAAYCMADKESANEVFEQFFPIIIRECTDERIYVKKAVNWALRSIGKRNIDLKKKAIKVAVKISKIENKAAMWIARDALKELQRDTVRISDYPRSIYRCK